MKKAAIAALAAAVVATLVALATCAGPRGAPATSMEGYPLEVGLKWIYRSVGNVAVVREIGRTVEIDGRRYFEMTYALPILGSRTLLMRSTPQGIVTSRDGREIVLLRFPMVRGDAWTIDLPGEREIADCTVLGEEEIEFLGRKGVATRLEVRRRVRDSDRITTDYEWYARGVGLVKMQVTFGVRATFVLESFGRGGEPAQAPVRR